MLKITILALVFGIVTASPIPYPLSPSMTGAVTTTHHSSASAHHVGGGYGHGLSMGYGMMGMGGYPGVVKHTETVSSGGYPATAALSHYSAYGAYPGLAGLGYGYPKQFTQQVTTTAVRPGMYGYF